MGLQRRSPPFEAQGKQALVARGKKAAATTATLERRPREKLLGRTSHLKNCGEGVKRIQANSERKTGMIRRWLPHAIPDCVCGENELLSRTRYNSCVVVSLSFVHEPFDGLNE